jgi:serine/threonine protein kinase
LKHVSAPIFQTAQTLKSVFGDNPRVRTHVDHNRTESALIYEFFTGDLLRLMDKTSLSLEARKWILREVGLALNDLHSKQWIHLGGFYRL